MKLVRLIPFILFFLVACSNTDEVNPNERFTLYTTDWENQEFDHMYEMFSSQTKENVTKEDSIERYEKIIADLQLNQFEISFTELTDDQLKSIEKDELASVMIPFSAKMNSAAGPISFDYVATLVREQINQEDDDDVFDWFIQWDPGHIFPDLKDGGQINIETVKPKRGEILDRNQMPLAMNDTVYQIGIIPGDLLKPVEDSIQQIANILNVKAETIQNDLSQAWVEDHLFVPVATILPSNEAVYHKIMQIPGIQKMDVNGRIYPGGAAASHLTGYVGNITAELLEELDDDEYSPTDQIGLRGLEQLFEERLKGNKGITIDILKEDGETILLAENEVVDGENIALTIDINIQQKLYNSFQKDAGTAAAINPKTGETLALVSAPAFDSNEILYSTSGNVWSKLESDRQNPLINRFVAKFAPGSVIKPITAAIGMKNGTLDPNETFDIVKSEWSNGEHWGGYKVRRVGSASGPVDLKDAMERSDNIYFAMQTVEMGSAAFISGLEAFGFTEDMPYIYPISASTISNSGNLDDEILLANSSYGQGELETSALHLATMYTPFINEGNLLQPTLLLEEETEQIWTENLLTAEQAKLMNDILRSVITDGTGKRADKDSVVPIAGKTGTVELKLSADVSGSINSYFVGYPYDSPDILIALLVEDTRHKESGIAIKKFAEVINQVYQSREEIE